MSVKNLSNEKSSILFSIRWFQQTSLRWKARIRDSRCSLVIGSFMRGPWYALSTGMVSGVVVWINSNSSARDTHTHTMVRFEECYCTDRHLFLTGSNFDVELWLGRVHPANSSSLLASARERNCTAKSRQTSRMRSRRLIQDGITFNWSCSPAYSMFW